MQEPVFTKTDMKRRSGTIIAEASREPIIITVRNKPTVAILSAEEYDRMIDSIKLRWAHCSEDIPPYLYDGVMAVLTRETSGSGEA